MQTRSIGLLMALATVWFVAGVEVAAASTGFSGLDAFYSTLDGGFGSTGYMLVCVALIGIIVSIMSGHYFATFGLIVLTAIAGAAIGHRQDVGSTLNLSLGAELSPLLPWPLELLP